MLRAARHVHDMPHVLQNIKPTLFCVFSVTCHITVNVSIVKHIPASLRLSGLDSQALRVFWMLTSDVAPYTILSYISGKLTWRCVLQMKESGSEQEDDQERKEGNGDSKPDEEKGEEDAGYEFSVTETTILEVVMDSMRTCGLAIGLLALSSFMLGMRTS